MEVCSISTTSQFKSSFRHLRCCVDKSYGDQAWENKNKNSNWASLKMNNKISRRRVMEVLGFSSMGLHAGVAYGVPSPMVEMKEPPQVSRIFKLPSGVKIEDVIEGEGPQAHEGDLVEVNYVCRRYNGYFVHSTVDQFSGESTPVILPLVDKKIIKGLKEVLVGMKVGGKRRALIPPSVGYVSESLQPIPEEFGPRRSLLSHVTESLVFEVQLLKVL